MYRLLFFSIFLAIIFIIDYYVFQAYKVHVEKKHIFKIVYIASTVLFFGAFAMAIIRMQSGATNSTLLINLIVGLAFCFFFTKIQSAFLFLPEDIARIARKLISPDHVFPQRSRIYFYIVASISTAVFFFFVYGITLGKYHYKLREITIESDKIPASFNGFKIVHISDIHAGTFDSKSGVMKGVRMINDQNPDLILFTGDMVNSHSQEVVPYIDVFSQTKAKYGKYGILGNHDYSLYARDLDSSQKISDVKKLIAYNEQMGFEMLLNDHTHITINGDSIAVAGVENWGLPPFPQFGNLQKATDGIAEGEYTVLMSHDPSHWDAEVKSFAKDIDLTLSGHTHGMQFGIYLPWFKWSLVKLKYKKWAGLFSENDKHMYVNVGYGFIAFPGRAGMRPEITVITLKSKK